MAFSAFEQIEWLAQTKFIPPVLRPDILARPRLTQTLQQALSTGRVLLVSAPAGYGKTTLLSTLPFILPDLSMAWVSLDEGDNDPIRFVIGLTTALRQLNSVLGQRLQTYLTATDPTSKSLELRKLMGLVINDIVELLPQSFVLVLDDLHRISEPEAYAALDYLIELLPRQMHMVIGTRYDPPLALARLRARGQLEELRTQDLRFTPSEMATFLNVSLRLDLSAQDLTSLQTRIEGWAAGLRLFASSFDRLTNQLGRDSLLRNLARSEQYVYDFLADEVLNRQEATTSRFLLETSILTELTPELCQAITGRQDAAALLEELYRRNLTITVEHNRQVYRYHDLFKAFLQHHLAKELPQQFVDLHRRLLYYLGIYAWQRGDTATVKEVLRRAIEGFAAVGEAQEQGESLVILAKAFITDHDTVQGRRYLEEALRFPIAPSSRVLVLMTRVWQGFWQRDWEQAARDVDEALDIGLAEPDTAVWNILGLQFRMELAVLPDGIARIERFWHNSVLGQLAEQNLVLQSSLSSLQAFSHLIRGRLTEAVQANERVMRVIGELEGAIWLISEVTITSLHIYLACNDSLGLDRNVELLHRFSSNPFFVTYKVILGYLEGRALWQQGRIQEARQIYEELPFDEEQADAKFLRLLLQALLEIADQRYHQAESTLKAAKELEPGIVLAICITDVSLILAYLYLQWDSPQKALVELEPRLAKCKAENTPGLILREGAIMLPVLELALKKGCHPDFAAKLLDLLGREVDPPEKNARTGGLLSSREAEVLHLLADGLSNREIADRLIISELTVKSHVTHLLQKLDATSRTGAVSHARQLGLLH